MASKGKRKPAHDSSDEREDDFEDLDEEDIDDELNLPSSLRNLSFQQKKELLSFKRSHNEREWEEEISRRGAAFERRLDYERLKLMTGASNVGSDSKQKPTQKSRSQDKRKSINSDSEDERREENFREEGEESDGAVDEEEDGLVADGDDFNQQSDDDEHADEDDDDLFDSDEEAEISKRPTKKTSGSDGSDVDDDDAFEDTRKQKKTSKVLGKRKSEDKGKKSQKRRSSRLSSHYDDDEEEGDDDDFEDVDEDEDDDEETGNDVVRYGDGDDDQHDYNIKSIKDSHRRHLSRDGMTGASSDTQRLSDKTALTFDNLSQLKAHLEKQLLKELPIRPDDHLEADAQDYRKLFRRRDDIVNNLHEPFFDQLMIGCYVRYLIGIAENLQIYRMCEIIGIDRSKKPYRLPPLANGTIVETNLRLHLNNAGEIKQYQRLDKVSNHSLQDKEISFHINGMSSHPEKVLPTKRDFRKLRQRHKQFSEHTYTHEDISHMVSSNLGLNKLITTEYSTAMTLLKKRLDEAIQRNDKEKIELSRKEIQRLEDITEKQRIIFEAHGKKQSDINRRMRESNVIRDMDAGMRKRHEEQEALSKGVLPNAISDPFIRRETRPKILWNTSEALKRKKEEAKAKAQEQENNKDKGNNGEKKEDDKKLLTKKRLQEEDRWAVSTQLTLNEVRRRVKQRLGVDHYGATQISKREKYLNRVCRGLPPPGSAERERLRGNNKSLRDYISLLSKNDDENMPMEEAEGTV